MNCPWCEKKFEPKNWVCDNDCHTEFCKLCNGEVYYVQGKLIKGHDPNCGSDCDLEV